MATKNQLPSTGVLLVAGALAFACALLLLWAPARASASVCFIPNGCTGTSTAPAYGQILIGGKSGEYELVASSTLGSAGGVTSVFGRTGVVTAQSGDYSTSLVPEGSNLYWTDARFDARLAATTSLPNIATLAGLSLPWAQLIGVPALFSTTSADYWKSVNNFFSTTSANYWLTTKSTSDLAEGSNLYYTSARSLADFITNLAATTSVKSITTLPSLSLPYSQLTGAPATFAYPFPSNATSTELTFSSGVSSAGLFFNGISSNSIDHGAAWDYTDPGVRLRMPSTEPFTIDNQGSSALLFYIAGDTGKVRLGQYGGGSITGTPAYNLVEDSSGNVIETALPSAGAPYPFQLSGNATSTKTQFNGGLTAYATSTIGAGAQATGLTINGGATTTLLSILSGGFVSLASSTLQNFTGINATTTNATTTSLFATTASTTSLYLATGAGILKAAASGLVGVAAAGTDYVTGSGTSGHCVQWGASNSLADAGSACGSGGSGAPYPFQLAGNATSTLTQFNGGLTSYATTTIGAGGQTTGLTVDGGATTTGSALFSSSTGTTTITNALQLGSTAANHQLTAVAGQTYSNSVSVGGAWNLTNTSNDGAGLVVYTNHASGATGRLLSVDCNSSTFDQNCFNLQSSGTASAFNLSAAPAGLGAFKWAASGAGDANSSGVSLDASTNSFLGAAMFVKCGAGTNCYTITDSASNSILRFLGNGNFGIAQGSPIATFQVGNVFMLSTTTASSTLLGNINIVGNSTTTNATTTSFAISGIASSLLKTNANGSVVPAAAGTDYDTFAWPFTVNTGYVSTTTALGLFASTTIGNGAAAGGLTVSGGATTTGLSILTGGFLASASSTLQNFTGLNSTTTNATSTTLFATTASTTNLYLATGNAMLKVSSGKVSAAANGTDYTLMSANTCTNQVFTAVTASGGTTCSTVSNAMLANSTIGATSPNSTLTVGSAASLGSTFTLDLNLANANHWTAKQTLDAASTTAITASGELVVPNGTNPTIANAGEIGVNTTQASSSLRFYDGTAERVLNTIVSKPLTYASSTLSGLGGYGASGTTTVPVMNNLRPMRVYSFFCRTDVGTAWVGFGSGTATTTEIQCTTGGTESGVLSTNNTFTIRQNFMVDVGREGSNPNLITITADMQDTAD